MMKNYDELVKINNNPNWRYFDEHSFRTVIIGVLGSVRTNMILNLIKHQRTDIDKMSKIHYLSTKRKSRNQKIYKKVKSIDYSQAIYDVHENLEEYKPTKKINVNSLR